MIKVKGVKQAMDKTKQELDAFKKSTMDGLLAGARMVERQEKNDGPRLYGNFVGI